MPDRDDPPRPHRGLLFEETKTVPERSDDDAPVGENPYWADPPPHPCPEKGCIRRGLCCQSSPGWFAPGEVERAAALLELTPDDFVRKHLVVDGCELEGHGWVHVFAPVKLALDGEPALPPASRVD